jgi:hypothetical protein
MSSISDVLAGLQATCAWQERVYKDLHAHPELSFHETETAAVVASKLGARPGVGRRHHWDPGRICRARPTRRAPRAVPAGSRYAGGP